METDYLKQLILFQETGSLSKSAEILHMSQPSLTRNMQKVESIFNVSLFERQKNRISLNENGIKACELAKQLIKDEENMIERIRLLDKQNNEITIGTCAPIPLTLLLSRLTLCLPDVFCHGESRNEETLINGLLDNKYSIILLSHPLNINNYKCELLCKEKLFISVTNDNKFYNNKSVTFKEINGTPFLLSMQIGIWKNLVYEKMPNTHFLETTDSESINEIASNSNICTFATDLGTRINGSRNNRKMIPIEDPSATMSFFVITAYKNKEIINAIDNFNF